MEHSGFTQVRNGFIRDTELSGEAKFLGVIYASFAGRDRTAYPGTKTLQRLTGWGRDKVKKARSELYANGLLTKKAERNERGAFVGVRYLVNDRILVRRGPENPSAGTSDARMPRASAFQANTRRTSHSHSQLGETTKP